MCKHVGRSNYLMDTKVSIWVKIVVFRGHILCCRLYWAFSLWNLNTVTELKSSSKGKNNGRIMAIHRVKFPYIHTLNTNKHKHWCANFVVCTYYISTNWINQIVIRTLSSRSIIIIPKLQKQTGLYANFITILKACLESFSFYSNLFIFNRDGKPKEIIASQLNW